MQSVDPPDLAVLPTLRRLLALFAERWRWAAIALVTALVYTGTTVGIPLAVQAIIDDVYAGDDRDALLPYLAIVAVLAVIRFAASFVRRYATSVIGISIEARMRELLFGAYLDFPRGFYDRHATGQVVSRATNDLYPIRYFMGWGVVQVCQSAMMIVAVGAVLLWVNPKLALVSFLAMPMIAYLTWRFASLVTPISRDVQQRKADVTETADEAVVGIQMVQAFGREDDIRGRFGARARLVRDGLVAEAGVEGRYLPAMLLMPSLAIAAVLLVGGRDVIHGDLTLGEFVLFQTLLLQLAWPLEALGWIFDLGQRAIASAGRSFAWIGGIDRLPEPPAPRGLPDGPLALDIDGVRFAYAAGEPVLRGVDLEVPGGGSIAVCGPTASGKTTLLGLLVRFYDPDRGAVRVGGVDVREVGLASLREHVAIVTQRPVLFSATLRENLVTGRPDATEDEVMAACAAAGVTWFLDDLPAGLDTVIGERGVNLSGGQRQRVALARALLTRARVLVLDDPLSAVDTVSERRLVEALRPALAGRTVVVTAQRLSSVALASRAAVLVDGRIVEAGAPDELLRAGGAFAALFADEVTRA